MERPPHASPVPGEGGGPPLALPVERRDKQGEPFTIRLYRPADREALECFYHDFEPKRGAQGLPPIGADRVARWLNAVLGGGLHLVACRAPELIGHGLLIPTDRPHECEYAVFLQQAVRGRGIGTLLNAAALEVARAAGKRRLWLSVEPQNRAAVRSYEKVGFRFLPHTIFSSEAEMELTL